jgi:hypothetical protein
VHGFCHADFFLKTAKIGDYALPAKFKPLLSQRTFIKLNTKYLIKNLVAVQNGLLTVAVDNILALHINRLQGNADVPAMGCLYNFL